MVRYVNQPLPRAPRIAVIANDAIGNFVMATPLLQMLAKRHPEAEIHYFGGMRTAEIQLASDLFACSFSLHGAPTDAIRELLTRAGSYDLIVNLESTALAKTMAGLLAGSETLVAGPSIARGGRGDLPFADDARGDLWRDREWAREGLTAAYPFLDTGFIAEIFCRLCYLEGPVPAYRVPTAEPPIAVPDVLIATAASLTEKLWPAEKWRALIGRIRQSGRSVGLIGAPPTHQHSLWRGGEAEEALIGEDAAIDLRGRFSLPEVVGALGRARAVATLDNGILHLAVAAGTPTVGIYRHGIHRLWAPPAADLSVLTPGEGCEVADLDVETVWKALELRLG